MPSINQISFCAKPIRQTYFKRDSHFPYYGKIAETTKDEFVRSYDRQIEKIQDYKDYAMKLDDMMFNDPDIKQSLEELPDELEIQVVGNFQTRLSDNKDEVEVVEPMLFASEKVIDNTPKAKEMSIFEKNDLITLPLEYNEQGPNKEEIIDWLDDLKTFFE